MRSVHSSPRLHRALRRLALVVTMLGIFAVGFGGSFTCKTEQNSADHTRIR